MGASQSSSPRWPSPVLNYTLPVDSDVIYRWISASSVYRAYTWSTNVAKGAPYSDIPCVLERDCCFKADYTRFYVIDYTLNKFQYFDTSDISNPVALNSPTTLTYSDAPDYIGPLSIAVDPTNGTIYIAANHSSGTKILGTLNASTGLITVIDHFSNNPSSTNVFIGFDIAGNLYGAMSGGSSPFPDFFSINKATCALTGLWSFTNETVLNFLGYHGDYYGILNSSGGSQLYTLATGVTHGTSAGTTQGFFYRGAGTGRCQNLFVEENGVVSYTSRSLTTGANLSLPGGTTFQEAS